RRLHSHRGSHTWHSHWHARRTSLLLVLPALYQSRYGRHEHECQRPIEYSCHSLWLDRDIPGDRRRGRTRRPDPYPLNRRRTTLRRQARCEAVVGKSLDLPPNGCWRMSLGARRKRETPSTPVMDTRVQPKCVTSSGAQQTYRVHSEHAIGP